MSAANPPRVADERVVGDRYVPGADRAPTAVAPETALHGESDTLPCPILVLAQARPKAIERGTLSWVSHKLGLDVFGQVTLSDAARIEMNAASMILLVVFCFDAVAWCLLVYFVVSGGTLQLDLIAGLLSLGGLLPALALLLYERGFITADTVSRGWTRLALPTLLRVLVIGVAAWITSVPVELIAFARRIEARVHSERIREDLVSRYEELGENLHDRNQIGYAAIIAPRARAAADSATNDLRRLGEERGIAEQRLDNLRLAAGQARVQYEGALAERERLRGMQSRPGSTAKDSAEYNAAAARLVRARTGRSEANAAVANQLATVARLDFALSFADRERLRAESLLVKASGAQAGAQRVDELRNWARALRHAPAGEDYENRQVAPGFAFRFVDYDFLGKLRILDDLREARPVRWPGASATMRDSLVRQFGMHEEPDSLLLAADAANANRVYWSIFGVAVLVPFMSLLFKLIMPASLAHYYSIDWQRRQGNPSALAMTSLPFRPR